ncbi:MAG: sulfatase [Kiritimatiellia bacterium]
MSAKKQPNIIVMVSHDTGRHISPYGIKTVRTPNAERLAAEGVMFTNSFCTSPGCCPSRAGLFSGRSPHAVGMLGQTGAWAGFRFSDQVTHAATHLKNLGYETMLLGGAHEVAGAGCDETYFDGIGFDLLHRGKEYGRAGQLNRNLADILDARTQPDKPFYLQIGTHETHTPYVHDGVEPFDKDGVTIPESPMLSRDGPGTHRQFAELQGAVNRLDEGLGHVLRTLEERGLTDNTLLVFTTDHGLPMPREKTTLYDRGIGVFLMMRFPGVFNVGGRYDQLVSNVDVLPTLIEAAGGTPPPELEGRSFYKLLTGGDYQPREMLFAEKTYHTSYDPLRCLRTKKFKYIFNFESVRPENYCLDISRKPVLAESLALLPKGPNRFDELYDLEADPGETRNLAEEPEYREVREKLAGDLMRWMMATDDPLLRGPVASPRFFEKLEWLQSQDS